MEDALEQRTRRADLGGVRHPQRLRARWPPVERVRRGARTRRAPVVLAAARLAGRDDDVEVLLGLGAHGHVEGGVLRRQARGRRREGQAGAAEDPVPPLVAEHHAVRLVHHRRPPGAARPLHEALQHEEILEARAERELHVQPDRHPTVVVDGHALVDGVATDHPLAKDADGVLVDDQPAMLAQHRRRQVVVRAEGPVGGAGERGRRRPVDPQRVAVEEPAVVEVEAVAVRALERYVAALGDHEEYAAGLEHDGIAGLADLGRIRMGEDPLLAAMLRRVEAPSPHSPRHSLHSPARVQGRCR